MAEITLTNGGVALVDDADVELVSQFKWCWLQRIGDTVRYAVATRTVGGKTIYMHKLILGAIGEKQGDHRNLNGLDNHRENLRPATARQNAQNRGIRRNKICRYKGVTRRGDVGKYRARIRVDGKLIDLGYFSDDVSAAQAYDAAATKYFGEFARLNFPATIAA